MANTESVVDFLKRHKQYFRMNDIERCGEIPQSTINRAMAGRSNLTASQERKILRYLQGIKNSLDKLFEK